MRVLGGRLDMKLSHRERDLVLRGLFELTITNVEDDELRREVKALAAKLGGKPKKMFFGAVAD
jgi:hypothetical protein